ncbi:ABC transporter transmembrane domain-containing protein [Ureibacillus thermophilus]|uniref:ABC transporter transmembrane domain-containing protein n=1 Tax=Ureibacillus thermophilus TaxID=367743 RepID=UPI003613D5E0
MSTAPAKAKFHAINDRLYENAWKSQFLSSLMMPIMQFIGNFGYVAVCIVGAYLVTTNAITIETIVAFIIYIRLFTQKPNLLKWEQIYNRRKRPVSGYLNFWKKKNWMRNIRNLQKWSMLKGR